MSTKIVCITRLPVSKQAETQTHNTPKFKALKVKTSMDKTMSRHRKSRKPKEVDLGMGIVQDKRGRHLRLN